MTTIAYRTGVLVADSLVSNERSRFGNTRKILRGPSGHFGGACGTWSATFDFTDWIAAGCKGEPPINTDNNVEGIIVEPDGTARLWLGTARLMPLDAPFLAIGSGALIAMGAMAAGANAYRAVQIASQYDINTGGPIIRLATKLK